MYKSIQQALIAFSLLVLSEGILSFPTIAQSLAKPDFPLKIKILGAVQRPGSYFITPVTPGSCNKAALKERYQDNSLASISQCSTINRAIQIAGGVTPEANVRQILVSRLRVNHSNQSTNFDLWKFLRFGDLTQNLLLQDGDTITVPTVENAALVQAPPNVSNPSATNVTVLGNVVRPGNFILPANATLNQALLAAGGLKRDRDNRKSIVAVLHLNPNGSTTNELANINLLEKSELVKPLVIRNNDILIITSSRYMGNSAITNILDLFSGLQFLGYTPSS